jgi:hypothetical protein
MRENRRVEHGAGVTAAGRRIHHSEQGSPVYVHRIRPPPSGSTRAPLTGSVGDAYENAMCESFFATLHASFSTDAGSRRRPRRGRRFFDRASHVEYERRYQQRVIDPDAGERAAVLAAIKNKPSGRPQEGAVLARRCARRPRNRAGRDGRMAPQGAEQKNSAKEDQVPSDQIR